jgi:hypothetical protein
MCAESQSVPPCTGVVRAGAVWPPVAWSPVSEWNHGNGKCLATYWSLACAPVKLVTPDGYGCAAVAVRYVGLLSGLLPVVPGPPQTASSRLGWLCRSCA